MDPSDAPLVRALGRARSAGYQPMAIPGHKGRYVTPGADGDTDLPPGFALLHDLIRDDIALQGGVDDSLLSGGFLIEAEALYAEAVAADLTRFLVGGSSQGNVAALLAAALGGSTVVVDRSSHRSAHSGLIVSGAFPHWVAPPIHPEYGVPLGFDAAALGDCPSGAVAAFVTTPAYVGTLSDVAAIAGGAHDRGMLLLVDQAWGAHLDFLDAGGAIRSGADVAVTSVHKALMGYSQTATLSARFDRLDRARLQRCVDLIATTSPSATLLASIDACRKVMVERGPDLVQRAAGAARAARDRLRRVVGLVVLDGDALGVPVDPLKIVLYLPGTGLVGSDLAAIMRQAGHGVESADRDTIVLTVSVADDPDVVDAVSGRLAQLIQANRTRPRKPSTYSAWLVHPDVVVAPRVAFQAAQERIPMSAAAGRVSAEQFCPYPPGVPILAPGERITDEVVAAIHEAAATSRVAYASDPSLQTVLVLT